MFRFPSQIRPGYGFLSEGEACVCLSPHRLRNDQTSLHRYRAWHRARLAGAFSRDLDAVTQDVPVVPGTHLGSAASARALVKDSIENPLIIHVLDGGGGTDVIEAGVEKAFKRFVRITTKCTYADL